MTVGFRFHEAGQFYVDLPELVVENLARMLVTEYSFESPIGEGMNYSSLFAKYTIFFDFCK